MILLEGIEISEGFGFCFNRSVDDLLLALSSEVKNHAENVHKPTNNALVDSYGFLSHPPNCINFFFLWLLVTEVGKFINAKFMQR